MKDRSEFTADAMRKVADLIIRETIGKMFEDEVEDRVDSALKMIRAEADNGGYIICFYAPELEYNIILEVSRSLTLLGYNAVLYPHNNGWKCQVIWS